MRAALLVAAVAVTSLAGATRAGESAGTISAAVDGEARGWVVAAGDSGWRPADGMIALTIVGHAEPAAGTIMLELTLTELAGDAARLFGTEAMLVAQDITYVPGSGVPPYASAAGGTVSVTIERFARDGDRITVAGLVTARLVGADGGDTVAVDGRFEVELMPLRR